MSTTFHFQFAELSGQALTAELRNAATNILINTGGDEATDAKGWFTFIVSEEIPAGFYRIDVFLGGVQQGAGEHVLVDGDATEFWANNYLANINRPASTLATATEIAETRDAVTAVLTAVGTPLQAGDYQTPLPATIIAAAVWSAAGRTLTGFEFDVETTVDTEALESVVTAAVTNALATGSWSATDVKQARYRLGIDGTAESPDSAAPNLSVSLSTSALAQLAGTKVIQIAVPTLQGQNLSSPLIAGDSYTAALEAAIEFSRSDFPDLSEDCTCKLSARKVDGDEGEMFTISGAQASIPVLSGTKVCRFEPTSSQTRLWPPGKYEFDVEITFPNGESRTFIGPNTFLRVLADMNQA